MVQFLVRNVEDITELYANYGAVVVKFTLDGENPKIEMMSSETFADELASNGPARYVMISEKEEVDNCKDTMEMFIQELMDLTVVQFLNKYEIVDLVPH